MKKFFKEFKEFAVKGNMFDMAVGVIIGSAFTGLVNGLINNIINPLIGLVTGNISFENMGIILDKSFEGTLAEAVADGTINVLQYGAFITAVINFIIMALVVFGIVKMMNKFRKKEEAPAPTTKKCPYCLSDIPLEAKKCAHCTSDVE